MDNIITNDEEYFKFLINSVNTSLQEVYISSFGFFMKGKDSLIKDFFDRLEVLNIKTNILISTADVKRCCYISEHSFYNRRKALVKFVESYPNFNIKFLKESHTKLVLFKYKIAKKSIIGGRNLSESNWNDISVVLKGGSYFDPLLEEWKVLEEESYREDASQLIQIKDTEELVEKIKKSNINASIVLSILSQYKDKGWISHKQEGVLKSYARRYGI